MSSTAPAPDLFPRLLGSALHDAKSSLGVLMERLEELTARCSVDPEGERLTAEIRYEIQRINHGLVGLLTFYKLQNGLYVLNPEFHAVSELLAESLAHHRALLDARGIAVTLDCDPLLEGCFDFNLVAGVVGNAINNALRYTRDALRLSAEDSGDGSLTIRVEDNGRGFPASLLARQRLADCDDLPETGFIGGGTGLGLHFAEIVARAHRNGSREGSIALDNDAQIGGGRFSLTLV